jgi:predicted ester cyclase
MQSTSRRVTFLFICAALLGCLGRTHAAAERSNAMPNPTHDRNKTAVRRLFEDGFNHQRSDVLEEVVAPEYVDAFGEHGATAFKKVIAGLRAGFPDIAYTVEELVAEDDAVAVRWHWTGTHRGVFRGIAPTERHVTNNGLAIFHLRSGKVVAATLETDRLGFLQGIGVVPPNEALFGARVPTTTAPSP